MKYAGFWQRFLASFIDSMLLAAVMNFSIWFIFPEDWKNDSMIPYIIMMVIGYLYFIFLESSAKRGTLGKIVLGLKVVDYNNKRISIARSTARNFSKILSSMILMIGYIMIAFTSRKQGLHDIISETLVIKTDI